MPPSEDTLARESDVTVSANATLYAEYRGYFMYVLSAVAFAMFIVWILAPRAVLVAVGISYYPDKYWAQALPAYMLMLMLYLYLSVVFYNNEVETLKLNDLRVFTDEHAVYPPQPVDYLWKSPSGVWDLPTGLVSEVLYAAEAENASR